MSYTLLVVLTILGWSIGAICCKIATNSISPMMLAVITTGMYVALMPFLFFFVKFDKAVNGVGLLFAILGAAAMALGSVASFFALKQGDAGITTILNNSYPAITLMLSVIFLKEEINLRKVAGLSVVLFGYFILIRR